MKYSIIFRILLYLALAFTVINGWWFVSIPLIIIGIWLFSFKFEILIAGIVYDALFGMVGSMGVKGYIGTIVAVVILGSIYLLKKVVR